MTTHQISKEVTKIRTMAQIEIISKYSLKRFQYCNWFQVPPIDYLRHVTLELGGDTGSSTDNLPGNSSARSSVVTLINRFNEVKLNIFQLHPNWFSVPLRNCMEINLRGEIILKGWKVFLIFLMLWCILFYEWG